MYDKNHQTSFYSNTKNCKSFIPIVEMAAPSVVPSVEGGLGAASVGPVKKKIKFDCPKTTEFHKI